jgi:putative transposase
MKYIKEENKIHACSIYVIFCTKYCKPVLENEIKDILHKTILGLINERFWEIYEIEIHPYYVFLHLQFNPKTSIHRVIKAIKSRTSNVLRKKFPELVTRMPSLWTRSYLVSTEKLDEQIIKKYLEEQKNV